MSSKRFEFIECTCPESDKRRHGHIYDNEKKENSFHIYNLKDGIRCLQSLPLIEISADNLYQICDEMNNFFDAKQESLPFSLEELKKDYSIIVLLLELCS